MEDQRPDPSHSPIPEGEASLQVYVALLLAVLFWGSSFPAIKIVMTGFTPISYVFLRFLGAALVFGGLIIVTKRYRRLSRGTHIKLALMGLFHPTLYFIFESLGLQYTSASSASILVAAVPGVVALAARFFLNEKLNFQQWAGVVLSVIGVIILAGFDDNPAYAESSLLGNGLVLLAILSAAIYMIIARKLSASLSAMELTFYQLFYSIFYLLPVFLLHAKNVDWSRVNPNAVMAILFLIVGSTLIAFLAYNYAITCIHVSKAAVFLNGVPVVAVVLSAFVLDEGLGILQVIGGVIVIAGVTLTNWRRSTRSAPGRRIVS